MTSTNTYTGTTTISAGATLRAGIASALSSGSDVTLASTGILDLNSLSQTVKSLSGSGSVTLGTSAATIFTIGGASTSTFNGVISGTGELSRVGGSITILGNNSSYAGATNIQNSSSEIQIAVNNALPTGTTLESLGTTNANVIFDLNGKNQQIAALTSSTTSGSFFIQNNSGAGTSVLTITNGTGSFTATTGQASIRDNDGVSTGGFVALTITGGTTTLSKAQGYTGATTINGGTLKVDGSLAAGSAVAVNDSGKLAGAGVINGPVTLTGGTTGASLLSAGTLTLASTFSVSGANNAITGGIVSVGGATSINTHGALTVNPGATLGGAGSVTVAGVLAINGISNQAVTVNSGGTLSGSGTVNANVAVGGTVAPGGTSIGTLTATNVSVGNLGNFNVKLGSAVAGPFTGNTNDLLNVSNTLNFATGSVLNISSLVGAIGAGTYSYQIATATTFQLDGTNVASNPFTYGSYTVGGAKTGPVTIDASFANTGDIFLLNSQGSSLILTYTSTATPEPAWALMIAAAGLFVWYGRRAFRTGRLVLTVSSGAFLLDPARNAGNNTIARMPVRKTPNRSAGRSAS